METTKKDDKPDSGSGKALVAQLRKRLREQTLEEFREVWGRLEDATTKLIAAADEIEHHYRHRGLTTIRGGKAEHPLFTDLFRATERAKRLLADRGDFDDYDWLALDLFCGDDEEEETA